MAVIKTFFFNNRNDYQEKVNKLKSSKYIVTKKEDKVTILKEKTLGKLFDHILIFFISLGLLNIPWAVFSRKKADEIKVVLDEAVANDTEEVEELFLKRKSEEKLWKIFLVLMAFFVIATYGLAYLSNLK